MTYLWKGVLKTIILIYNDNLRKYRDRQKSYTKFYYLGYTVKFSNNAKHALNQCADLSGIYSCWKIFCADKFWCIIHPYLKCMQISIIEKKTSKFIIGFYYCDLKYYHDSYYYRPRFESYWRYNNWYVNKFSH